MALEITQINDGAILKIKVGGKLSKDDYDLLVPEVEQLVKKFGKISMLFEMHDFHGWRAGALWEDTKFAVRHFSDIERLAMIGEKKWQKGMSIFCKPFTTAKIRYFEPKESEQALEWLKETSFAHTT